MNLSTLRRILLGLGLAAATAAPLPALAQTAWTLPSAYPPANFHTENLQAFAADVKTATGGKLEITVRPNATLYKAPEIKRSVQAGLAQAGEVLISLHENEEPVFGLDVVPFVATSYAQSKKLWDAERASVEAKLEAQGLKFLYQVPWPPQGIFAKKEIGSVADLKGARWRAYNAGTTRIGELVGAQAVTVQAAELPQALATGVVDTFMTSSATGVDSKVWETMTHFYDVQAWLPRNVVFANKAAFDALDKETQDAVMKAASAAETRGWAMSEEKNKGYIAELAKNGMKVLPPSETLTTEMKEIGKTLAAQWAEKTGPDGQAILDAFNKP